MHRVKTTKILNIIRITCPEIPMFDPPDYYVGPGRELQAKLSHNYTFKFNVLRIKMLTIL